MFVFVSRGNDLAFWIVGEEVGGSRSADTSAARQRQDERPVQCRFDVGFATSSVNPYASLNREHYRLRAVHGSFSPSPGGLILIEIDRNESILL